MRDRGAVHHRLLLTPNPDPNPDPNPNPEVRYIIDYYDASASREAGGPLPSLHDPDGVPTILMDVRPAGEIARDHTR